MAISVIELAPPSGAQMYKNTDLDGTKSAVKASSGTLYGIVVDNAANGAASYLKMWDLASGNVTVGTTNPDWTIKIPASVKKTIAIPEGLAFGTALTVACVTTAIVSGVTNPTENVAVDIVYS